MQIRITFNSSNLQRPTIDIARTMIHEMIHAEIFRKLLSLAQEGSIPWSESFITSLKDDFPGLWDYYWRWWYDAPAGISPTDPQHELMAQHYRGIIEQVLEQFADNVGSPYDTISDEEIEALAWAGLMGNGTFNPATGLFTNSTTAWSNLSQSERLNIVNTRNQILANYPDCE